MRINRFGQASAAALLAFTLSTSHASAQVSNVSPTVSSTDVLAAIKIFNFGRINANYYRGAHPDVKEVGSLANLGIKTVIDLRSDDDRDAAESKNVEKAGMKYVSIPMSTHETPSTEKLEKFLKLVNDPANQPVYVHCVEGKHRTGVMTAAYRMTGDGWNSDQAFSEMKQFRFGADFLHKEFKRFVYAFKPTPTLAATFKPTPALAAAQPVIATAVIPNTTN